MTEKAWNMISASGIGDDTQNTQGTSKEYFWWHTVRYHHQLLWEYFLWHWPWTLPAVYWTCINPNGQLHQSSGNSPCTWVGNTTNGWMKSHISPRQEVAGPSWGTLSSPTTVMILSLEKGAWGPGAHLMIPMQDSGRERGMLSLNLWNHLVLPLRKGLLVLPPSGTSCCLIYLYLRKQASCNLFYYSICYYYYTVVCVSICQQCYSS